MKNILLIITITVAFAFASDANAKKKKEKQVSKETSAEMTDKKSKKVAQKTIRCKRTRATGTRMSSQICADKKTRDRQREESQEYMKSGRALPAEIPGVSGG
ncbi:hypothetical protein [Marinicella sp. W31]|uniref:hypothetical protein n=1 Tax=Marinicella sp. W31 TaxID=3023713 RepID=UPI003757F234